MGLTNLQLDYEDHIELQRLEFRNREFKLRKKADAPVKPQYQSVETPQKTPDEIYSTEDQPLGELEGVVKRFGDYSKPGFGYIIGPDENEYFVHFTNIKSKGFKNLASGQHVNFKGYKGSRGYYAREVTVCS